MPLVPSPDEGARERIAALGAPSLSDRELLTLVLGAGGGRGGGALAARLIQARFPDLHALDRAAWGELLSVPGVGRARAARLLAAMALGRRVALAARPRGVPVRSAADVHQRLSPLLRHLDRETFVVVLLDSRHRILREERVAEGGLTACAIHPREVFEPAVRERAAAVVFAHNHPSGDPTPSAEDLALTGRLVVAAEALGIRALDHLVVGDGSFVSLADEGLMLAG